MHTFPFAWAAVKCTSKLSSTACAGEDVCLPTASVTWFRMAHGPIEDCGTRVGVPCPTGFLWGGGNWKGCGVYHLELLEERQDVYLTNKMNYLGLT